jgi:hypothetical protein
MSNRRGYGLAFFVALSMSTTLPEAEWGFDRDQRKDLHAAAAGAGE